LCIKLDTHLPYDHDARSHKLQIYRCGLVASRLLSKLRSFLRVIYIGGL
jgi:hypothetical protein